MTNAQPVAVVTGGSKGIGRAIAAALLESGRPVLITGRAEARLRARGNSLPAPARRRLDHQHQQPGRPAPVRRRRRVLGHQGRPECVWRGADAGAS